MADIRKTSAQLIMLVKSAIGGEKIKSDVDFDGCFDEIMYLANSHELAHLAAMAMIKGDVLKDEKHRRFAEKRMFDASYRDTKNRYTYDISQNILNDAQISFIPLKGAIIKKYYPECWMRTSCDIDVLIQKKDFNRAISLFKQNGFNLNGDLNFHDVSLLYDDTNLELHFSICENIKSIDFLLKDVWDYAQKADGYKYLEQNDYFVFHHMAHMAYHFLAGGCGIRPFVDLWILKKAEFFDCQAVEEMCKKAKIDEFFRVAMELVEVWFENRPHNDITLRMEKYVLTGGAYGYYPNNAAAYTVRNGGKIKYLFSLAFPPYRNMKVLYPLLNRIPVLLPFCYIYRLFQKTIGKNNDSAKEKFSVIKEQNKEFIKEVSDLIKMLKLDKK